MITTVTSKGQVTIPKTVRKAAGIKPGDKVVVRATASGGVYVGHPDNASEYEERLRALAKRRTGEEQLWDLARRERRWNQLWKFAIKHCPNSVAVSGEPSDVRRLDGYADLRCVEHGVPEPSVNDVEGEDADSGTVKR